MRRMLTEAMASLAGLRGKELKAAKERIVAALEPDALASFLPEAAPAEIKKVAQLFGRDLLHLPPERVLPAYEATWAAPIPPKTARARQELRQWLAGDLDAPTALACLERHPEDPSLVQIVSRKGSVGQLRRAVALGPQVWEADHVLEAVDGAPEPLGVRTAQALAEFGVAWKPACEAVFPAVYGRETGTWSGTDPRGALAGPTGGGWIVASQAVFPDRAFPLRVFDWDDAPTAVRLTRGGEVVDVDVDGRRRILWPIGYVDEKQLLFCVDIVDPAPEVMVFTLDHDGTGPSVYTEMLSFLYRLRTP
ncbi:MAG: hypothetical protein R3F59_31005 [Myxococcota bacterium]